MKQLKKIYDDLYICRKYTTRKRIIELYLNDKLVLKVDLNAWVEFTHVKYFIEIDEQPNDTTLYFSLQFDSCLLHNRVEFDKMYIDGEEMDLYHLITYGILKKSEVVTM